MLYILYEFHKDTVLVFLDNTSQVDGFVQNCSIPCSLAIDTTVLH